MTDAFTSQTTQALALPPQPIAPDIVKQIAMDIGKDVAHYIEMQYPHAVSSTASTFLLAVRNHTYNQIIAALQVTDEAAILARLEANKQHRRRIKAMRKAGKELAREREANPPKTPEEALARLHEARRRNGTVS